MRRIYFSGLLSLALFLAGGGTLKAQTDVTSQYLTNPSFEYSADGSTSKAQALKNGGTYYGWTLPNLGNQYNNLSIGDASSCNGEGLGIPTPADGNYYYFNRKGWNGSGADYTLSTTTKAELEVGHYSLTFSYKGYDVTQNGATGTGSHITLNVVQGTTTLGTAVTANFPSIGNNDKNKGTALQKADWKTQTLEFDVTTAGSAAFNFVESMKGGVRTDIVIDNLKLEFTAMVVKTSLQSAITSATTINAALNNADLTTAIATAQDVYDNASATQDDVNNAVTTLNAAVENAKKNIANNTDVTAVFVTNNSFETGDLTGWDAYKATDTQVTKSEDNYATANIDGTYLFNTWGGNAEKYVRQTLTNLPEGYYQVSALVASDNNNTINLLAGDTKTPVKTTDKGTFVTAITGKVYVADGGSLQIGASSTTWYKVDDFRLTFFTKDATEKPAYDEAIAAAKAIDQTKPMNGEVLKALQDVISAYGAVTSAYGTATTALSKATSNATASIDAYTKAGTALAGRKNLTEATTVYTADALKTYYTDPQAKYDDRTLTDAEANALTDPYSTSEYKKDLATNSFLGSAFGVTEYNTDVPYANTWSTEGNSDGSNFKTPFYEYWVSDGNTLADKTLTGSVTGLTAGQKYKVKATVRVRLANGKTAPATGVTLDVNGENSVAVTGEEVGNTQFYLDTYNAIGTADETGAIKVNFNVKSTNISWLSFQPLVVSEMSAKDAYEETLAAAKNTLADEVYTNVTGSEKDALSAAINATVEDNDEAYNTATTTLNTAVNAFTAAKTAYDGLIAAQTAADGSIDLPYASTTAKESYLNTLTAKATNADDAIAKTAAITTALRAYYENNSIGGKYVGTAGYKDYTENIANPNATDNINGWTLAQKDGNKTNIASKHQTGNQPTAADGTVITNYFDGGGDWNSSDWTTRFEQTVTGLVPGKYLLSVTSRGSSNLRWFNLYVGGELIGNKYTGDAAWGKQVALTHQGGQGGVFGNGYDDAVLEFTISGDNVLIGVGANCPAGTTQQWQSFTRFRLVKIADLETVAVSEDQTAAPEAGADFVNVTLSRKFNANAWNTLVLPFDMTAAQVTDAFGADAKVANYTGTTDNEDGSYTLNFETSTTGIKANTPVFIYGATNADATLINGVQIKSDEPTSTPNEAAFSFVGTYQDGATAQAGDWFISSDNNFYKAIGTESIKALRAVFRPTTPAAQAKGLKVSIDGGAATGISGVKSVETGVKSSSAVYTLSGQKVAERYDATRLPAGVYIVNGKKVVKK